MKVTVVGSHLCPDTLYALQQLAAAGAEIDFKDILSCHADLKAYLNLRDNSDLYAQIRGTECLGIPCFIKRRWKCHLRFIRSFKVIREIFFCDRSLRYSIKKCKSSRKR